MEKQTRKGRNGGTINVWRPGESGNPEGPKPGYVQAKTVLKRLLAARGKFKNPLTGEEEEMQLSDALHLVQIQKAMLDSDTAAYREIMDRIEGKSKQGLELTGEDGDAIKVEQKTTILNIAFRKPEDATSSPADTTPTKKPRTKSKE